MCGAGVYGAGVLSVSVDICGGLVYVGLCVGRDGVLGESVGLS